MLNIQRREAEARSLEPWRLHIVGTFIALYAAFAVAVTILSIGVR